MLKPLFIAAAAFALIAAALGFEAEIAPLLKRAEAASEKGDWNAAIIDLRAVRDIASKKAGADDPQTLRAGTLLVQALTQSGQYEQAIAEGIAPLKTYSTPETKANIDGLYLRYSLAHAFSKCLAARCGDEPHRMGNVDALMEAMMAGLSTYKRGDTRVAELRAIFTETCTQRYEPTDCANANGK